MKLVLPLELTTARARKPTSRKRLSISLLSSSTRSQLSTSQSPSSLRSRSSTPPLPLVQHGLDQGLQSRVRQALSAGEERPRQAF